MAQTLELPTVEELMWMEPAELEAALVTAERARRLTESVLIDVMDVADSQRVWAADGHRSVKNWVVALTGVSPVEAGRRAQTLRAVRDLDALREELRAGEVGVCQTREMARLHANRRVRERLGRAEKLLVGLARRRCFDEFHVRAERWRVAADPDGAARTSDETHAGRRVDARFTAAGFTMSAHGARAPGVDLLGILDAFADAEFHVDWDEARAVHGDATTVDHLARTEPQRGFDALCAIFRAAASGEGGRARVPTVNLVCDVATFEEHLAHAAGGRAPRPADPADTTRRSETTDGVVVDPRDAVVAALVGHVRRVVVDSGGVVVDAGRRRRLFTGPMREVVWIQGAQCLWPGCSQHARQQDHGDEWAGRSGGTDTANGGAVCGHHNRWKTRGYTTRRDADGAWHVHRPDGTNVSHPHAA